MSASPQQNPSRSDLLDTGNDSDIPDGGLAAWLTVVGAQVFLIQIGGFGFVNAFGVFQGSFVPLWYQQPLIHPFLDYYSQYYLSNYSSSAISWIGSTNSFLILSGGLFFGRLYDNGYFHWLVIIGSFLQTLCLFMLSLTQRNQFYQVFLCHGLGFGLATSMGYVPSLAVLSQHFKKKSAIAMCIVAAGTPLGAALYTILLNNLLNGKFGFANSIRITAAVNTALLVIGCALMRTRSPYSKTNIQTRYFQLLKTSSGDYPYLFACTGLFLFGAGAFFPFFYIQLDSAMHGLGKEFSFYTIVILNGGNFIGRVTGGFIAGCFGISNAVIGSTLSAGAFTIAMTSFSNRAAATSIGFLIGYFAGVYVALSAPLMEHLTHNFSELGARMGIGLFLAGLGSLIGTPLAGALLGSDYTWWRPAVFCGVLCIASTFMFVATELVLRRETQKILANVAP